MRVWGARLAMLAVVGVGGCAAGVAGTKAMADTRRFEVQAGATFFSADASFASVRGGRPAIGVDLDELGIGSSGGRFFASASWHVSDRWVLQFDTFGFDNDGRRLRQVEVGVGDLVIGTEALLEGWLELDLYVLNLGYRLHRAGGFEAGAGAGVHFIDLNYGLSATLDGDAAEMLGVGSSDRFPAPNLYGWAGYRFNDRLQMNLKSGWLSVSYGDYDGGIWFVRSALQYRLGEHVGLGAGYWLTDFDVDRQTDRRSDSYEVRLRGPFVYLKATF
jgi:hypothetical protein